MTAWIETRSRKLGDCNNLSIAISNNDKFTFELLSIIQALYIRWIKRVCFHTAKLHERPTQNTVKMRFFRKIHGMHRSSLSRRNWPFTNTEGR